MDDIIFYTVLHQETETDKYNVLRSLIEQRDCPTIVYVSRTRRTRLLAEKLTSDGFPARPYNGKMDPSEKIANQDAFIRGEVKIIVATSAFGMGVDKIPFHPNGLFLVFLHRLTRKRVDILY